MVDEPKRADQKGNQAKSEQAKQQKPKVAVGCQGGGIHASFEVGVLTEILRDIHNKNRFELVGLSGTSAGALCTLMAWYGLAQKNGQPGSPQEAIDRLNDFWEGFAASSLAERLLNFVSYTTFRVQETEVLGFNATPVGLNPSSKIAQWVAAGLPLLGVRQPYYDLETLLAESCPDFCRVDWDRLQTRLLIGASEIMEGVETTFDSDCRMTAQGGKHTHATVTHRWRERLPLSLEGVAASGTLPQYRETERIGQGYYWDGLYSQNPPVREFLASVQKSHVPDEIWIVRINPQQCADQPKSTSEIEDRQNELAGNLSLNKELDFVLTVNDWIAKYGGQFACDYKPVTVRTIKMSRATAAELRYSSKFNRNSVFMHRLRDEGREIAGEWLDQWPQVGCYPNDAAY
jgi:NTE family protein